MVMLPGQMESHLYVMWMGSALWRIQTSTMMIVPRSWEIWSSGNLHPHYTFPGLYHFSWMTHLSSPQHLERCEWPFFKLISSSALSFIWATHQRCCIS
jgi:hypothetical protein